MAELSGNNTENPSGARALDGLFPAQVSCSYSSASLPESSLAQAESHFLGPMSPPRRQSFIQGRYCARQALAGIGINSDGIGIGSSREPQWPQGVVGSISHKAGHSAAVTALRSQITSLGLDIEQYVALEADVIAMVSRPEERQDPGWYDWADGNSWSVLFSMKESIYKCLWPLLESYVDFQEVRVTLDRNNHAFSAHSHSGKLPHELTASLRGRYRIEAGLIITGAWISA